MITRVVKLTFSPEDLNAFKQQFDSIKHIIIEMPGCQEVRLLQNTKYENVLFTISKWESEAALNAYRKTTFFKETWANTSAKFCALPQAWTLNELELLN